MAKITIDKLAEIINKGFDGQMEYMDKRFGKIEKTLTAIKKDTVNIVHREEFDKLEGRVEYLENIIKISASKK